MSTRDLAYKHGIPAGSVIRYRKGGAALMKAEKIDELCGYRTYSGQHLYGEPIMVEHTDNCRRANEEEMKLWKSHLTDRETYYD